MMMVVVVVVLLLLLLVEWILRVNKTEMQVLSTDPNSHC